MKNPRIVKAYDTVTPSDQQKKQMLRAILQEANFPEEPVRPPKQKERQKTVTYTAKPTKTSKKSSITAIAASIALLAISAGVLLHLMRPPQSPVYVAPTETTEATIAQESISEQEKESSLTDYYEGFDDILAKYEKALTQGWSYQQCEQADISPQILTALPKLGWCLMDLDGNGVKELVISDTVHLYDLFVMMPHDGGPGHLVCGNGDTWYALCENGVIEKNVFYSSAKNWHYYTLKDTDLVEEYVIRYEGDMKNQYYYGTSLDTLQPISEDEAGNRIATQRTAELNLTPFTAQPSDAIDEMEYYEPLIARYRQALTEKWNPGKCMEEDLSIMVGYVGDIVGELGYALRDLDGDGVNELIVTDGEKIYDLYTILQDEITGPLHLRTASERTNYYLTEDNGIYCFGSGSAFVSYHTLCRLDGMEWIQLEGYLYDARTDPDNPWYFFDGEEGESHDSPCGDLNVQGIIDSYNLIDIPYTPIL